MPIRFTECRRVDVPLSHSQRYLPEGLQLVQLDGRDLIGMIRIQDGKEARTGGLSFMSLEGSDFWSCDLTGRPGFFRPYGSEQNRFIAGMDNQIATVCVSSVARSARCETLDTLDPKLADGERLMCNDGTQLPDGSLLVGIKDYQFDQKAQLGRLLHWRKGRGAVIVHENETCPNGNFFFTRRGKTFLGHFETGAKSLWAIEYAGGEFRGTAELLFSFGEAGSFPTEVFHDALMPDGCCSFTDGGRQKVIVAIFDFRRDSQVGQALQFDVTDGFLLEGVYRLPGSPRVTHPLIVRNNGAFKVWFTTASEGLFEMRGTSPESDPGVGALYVADLQRSASEIVIH